jgi:hypothetical protein
MTNPKYDPKDFDACPFCRGGIEIRSLGTPWQSTVVLDSFDIQCIEKDCGIRFTGTLPDGLGLTAWNRRAPDQHQQNIIKAAVKAIEDIEEPDQYPCPTWRNIDYRKDDGDPVEEGTYERCPHMIKDWDSCQECIVDHLSPHLKALKGLIDG